jgi:hypothetical protein
MTRTYLFGWSNDRRTLAEMETRPGWSRVHPEIRKRLIAMFDASQDVGKEVGFGEGWRSSELQARTFRDRHTVVQSGWCCSFDGLRWQLKPGMAHAAPPGRSYHEETLDGFALAADLTGDLQWMNANCDRYALRHFANVNNEPWHVQPVEVPTARSNYNGSALDNWQPATPPPPPPPPPPKGSEMFDQIWDYITCPQSTTPAVFAARRDGTKVWLVSQEVYRAHQQLAKDNGYTFKLRTFNADQFRALGPVIGPRPRKTDEWGM